MNELWRNQNKNRDGEEQQNPMKVQTTLFEYIEEDVNEVIINVAFFSN